MTKPEYETLYTRITVKPTSEPIFSERSTDISIIDEGAGCFVEVAQDRCGKLQIDLMEWPAIRDAIESMLRECERINARDEP